MTVRMKLLTSIALVVFILVLGATYVGLKIGAPFSVPNSISSAAQEAFDKLAQRYKFNVRIWTPPRLQAFCIMVVGSTAYVYPAFNVGIRRCRAIMGYSRARSQLLCRAFRTRTLTGFSSAGSTSSPSFSLLRNRK